MLELSERNAELVCSFPELRGRETEGQKQQGNGGERTRKEEGGVTFGVGQRPTQKEIIAGERRRRGNSREDGKAKRVDRKDRDQSLTEEGKNMERSR